MRKKDQKKSKKRVLDKVVMGAVIGGAIGSVIGASIAPKKGKETREDLKKLAKEGKKKGGFIFSKVLQLFSSKKDKLIKNSKKIPNEMEK